MTFTVNTIKRIITIIDTINIKELLDFLKIAFPDDWEDWIIETKYEPYYIYPTFVPVGTRPYYEKPYWYIGDTSMPLKVTCTAPDNAKTINSIVDQYITEILLK